MVNAISEADILSLLLAGLALVIAILAIIFPVYYQRRANQLSGLQLVHGMLANKDSREVRREVFAAARKYQSSKSLRDFDLVQNQLTEFRGDLDIIGSMIHEKLVPRKVFLDVYAGLVIRSWKAMKPTIEFEREARKKNPRYLKYFEELYNEAEAYWRREVPELSSPEPY